MEADMLNTYLSPKTAGGSVTLNAATSSNSSDRKRFQDFWRHADFAVPIR
jgi:hypothetical protein